MKPLAPRLISFARKASAISSGERTAPLPPWLYAVEGRANKIYENSLYEIAPEPSVS